MKQKKSFSKLDYYLMLLDEFKDQYTLVIVLNFIIIYIAKHFQNAYQSIYVYSRFNDVFQVFSFQFDLEDFFEVLGYIYLASLGVHLGIYKKNKKWLFRLNAALTSLVLLYVWSLIRFDSLISILEKFHPLFILVMIGQLIFFIIAGKELIQLVNFKRKQAKINHS